MTTKKRTYSYSHAKKAGIAEAVYRAWIANTKASFDTQALILGEWMKGTLSLSAKVQNVDFLVGRRKGE